MVSYINTYLFKQTNKWKEQLFAVVIICIPRNKEMNKSGMFMLLATCLWIVFEYDVINISIFEISRKIIMLNKNPLITV